jgi:hypothetical protein
MLYQYALGYVLLSDQLADLAATFQKLTGSSLDDDVRESVHEQLGDVSEAAHRIDLTLTAKLAERMREGLSADTKRSALAEDYRALHARFQDELEGRWFYYVPLRLAPYYDPEKHTWGQAVDKFPSALFDIAEAGKCFSLGRNTACVLHLMRGLEPVLTSLAARFRVPYDQASWNSAIERISSHIRKLEQAKRKPTGWKADRQFFSELASDFRLFKDAWRNYAMHAYQKYDEEEARTIYDGVRAFMRLAATRLAEKGL